MTTLHQRPLAGRSGASRQRPRTIGTAAQGRLLILRETVAVARPKTPTGHETLCVLADLLKPVDPAATSWDVNIIDDAMLAFSKAVGAHISVICMEMLRLCCRRDQVPALRPDIAATIDYLFRFCGELTEALVAGCQGPPSAREHGRVCAHRPAGSHRPRTSEVSR